MKNDLEIEKARKKWLAQLRSPDAKRWEGELENSQDCNARCCLGHACHALGVERSARKFIWYGIGGDKDYRMLPQSVAKQLDITHSGKFKKPITVFVPDLDTECTVDNLAELNDESTLEPAEMADIIEEQFANGNLERWICI